MAVELPKGNHPRSFRRFEVFGDTLRFADDPVPDGSNCTVYYHALHVLNGSQTLPARHDQILIAGAVIRAARARAADIAHEVTSGGPTEVARWNSIADRWEQTWQRRHALRNVKLRRYYVPEEPLPSQDTDPGP